MPHKFGVHKVRPCAWNLSASNVEQQNLYWLFPSKWMNPTNQDSLPLKLLPFCYWHEYLDIIFLFKCAHGLIKSDILLEQFDSLTTTFNLRSTNNSIITYNIPKVRTLCHQNSYFVRVTRVWNTLPDELRKPDISFLTFKACLYNYYYSATLTVFDQDNMQTWKSVCVKCHKAGQLAGRKMFLIIVHCSPTKILAFGVVCSV